MIGLSICTLKGDSDDWPLSVFQVLWIISHELSSCTPLSIKLTMDEDNSTITTRRLPRRYA